MKQFSIFIIIISLFLFACNSNENNTNNNTEVKELLIHCGVTMAKPMLEIAKIIEEQENCKILITTGGSGNLYKSIITNKIGDLYLPGSKKYIEDGNKEKIITEEVFVGINKVTIMVQKGNPKNIGANFESLTNKDYRIVIGNPNSGSIGKETKKILEKIGVFDEVKNRAEYLTTDSKDLIQALKNDESDIIINWYATSTWDENRNQVEVLSFENEVITEKELYIGLLLYSQYPEIAKKFMEYASSDEGIAIFKKYGLY